MIYAALLDDHYSMQPMSFKNICEISSNITGWTVSPWQRI